jgi:predicted TIM-barrel fold metal-dependent hydrolase
MNIIDPHLHLFNLEQGDYHWLTPDNPPFWPDKNVINKNFAEQDILLQAPLTLSGFVHIEAGFNNNQPWQEIQWLEQHCQLPFVSIAAIDLTASTKKFSQQLDKLIQHRSVVGVRHILDQQALTLLSNKQVQENFTLLNEAGLVFEVQMPLTEHAPVNALCDVINKNSNIDFIINHAGFPPENIQHISWQRWQNNLVKLASYPHVAIKCSGWEMSNRQYQTGWLNENLTLIFTIFEKSNIMLASNFPLCLLSKNSYHAYWQFMLSIEFMQTKTTQEKNTLLRDNALNWYQLKQNTKKQL